jgi:hypothetical protein
MGLCASQPQSEAASTGVVAAPENPEKPLTNVKNNTGSELMKLSAVAGEIL